MFRILTAVFAGLLWLCPAFGQDWAEAMKEAAWDWHPGDMIFRNSMSKRDDLIRDAEGGKWATAGMLRAASGDPRVVYVDEKLGVTEIMLDQFIEGLTEDDYAVYRISELDVNNLPGRQVEQGPLMRYALFIVYGSEYDPFMLLGNGRFYNAELPYMTALNSGVILGSPVTPGSLGAQSKALRDDLLTNWEQHPHCNVQSTGDECWEMIKGTAVITPRVLIESPKVGRVFPVQP